MSILLTAAGLLDISTCRAWISSLLFGAPALVPPGVEKGRWNQLRPTRWYCRVHVPLFGLGVRWHSGGVRSGTGRVAVSQVVELAVIGCGT
ncbi:unnamed protein product [Leptidea sinapis]|uniref:Secreted protein n=1 Tax=Leptidea sinapis TaxID=189913 RepID=A0A5E4R3V5_9NEOP|nr:unnamed protein product [Leptidea sinapis]